jgi:hypothetical protein
MQKVAVFVNDVDHARGVLQPLLQAGEPTHWIVVACVPTLTRHIGRWVSNAARRQRAERWGDDLFAQLEPALRLPAGSRVDRVLVQRQVHEAVARLQQSEGPLRLLDARRPRPGRPDEPLGAAWPAPRPQRDHPLVATTGIGFLLAFAD